MRLLQIALIYALILTVNTSAHGQAPFAECPEAANAENYALWGVQLVEDCNPTPSVVESLRPALADLLGHDLLAHCLLADDVRPHAFRVQARRVPDSGAGDVVVGDSRHDALS